MLLRFSERSVCRSEDHSSSQDAQADDNLDIGAMSKLVIRLLMANDRLHSSSSNDISIREKQLASPCAPTQR